MHFYTIKWELTPRKVYGSHLNVIIMTLEGCPGGSLYSLDWTTGLDYWTGLLDWLFAKNVVYQNSSISTYSNS